MAKSTAPILLIGASTMFENHIVVANDEIDWRVPIATLFAAGGFALLEKLNQPLVVGIAWVALVTAWIVPVTFTKPNGGQVTHYPFIQVLLKHWNEA